MSRWFVSLLVVLWLAGCGGQGSGKGPAAAASQPLQVAPEDMLVVQAGARTSGPVITGSIQPETRADLRAEVSAVVTQVAKDNGDAVRRGELLLRLDDTSIRDQLDSALEAERASARALLTAALT